MKGSKVTLLAMAVLVPLATILGCSSRDAPQTTSETLRESSTAASILETVVSLTDWPQYSGGGVTLRVPPQFDTPLTSSGEISGVLKEIEAKGLDFETAETMLQGLPDIAQTAIFALDPKAVASGSLTYVAVSHPQTPMGGATTEQSVTSAVDSIVSQPGVQLVRENRVQLSGYKATELVLAYSSELGGKASELIYLVEGTSSFWIVLYLASPTRFVTLFEDLQKSAQTLTLAQ